MAEDCRADEQRAPEGVDAFEALRMGDNHQITRADASLAQRVGIASRRHAKIPARDGDRCRAGFEVDDGGRFCVRAGQRGRVEEGGSVGWAVRYGHSVCQDGYTDAQDTSIRLPKTEALCATIQ